MRGGSCRGSTRAGWLVREMHTRLGTETQTAAPCDALPRSGPDGPGEEAFVSMHSGRALWLVLVLASCESAPAVPQNVVPQNVVRDSNDLIHVLTSQGYEVSTLRGEIFKPDQWEEPPCPTITSPAPTPKP